MSTPPPPIPPDGSQSNQPPLLPAHAPGASRLRWAIHLLLITAFPVVIGVAGAGRSQTQQPALGRGPLALMWISAVEVLIFGVVFGLAWLASRASASDLRWRWRRGFWTVPLGMAYSVALRLAVGIVVAFIATVLLALHVTTTNSMQHFLMANRPDVGAIVDIRALHQNPFYFWLAVTVVSFGVGGLREELWRSAFLAGTRGVWPERFSSTAGQIAAAALAAVAFGIGHLAQGVLAVGLTALLGFGLGLIMIFHRSIWPSVIAHGTFDATSMALLPWVMQNLPHAG